MSSGESIKIDEQLDLWMKYGTEYNSEMPSGNQ
jgi:hypothetical protein